MLEDERLCEWIGRLRLVNADIVGSIQALTECTCG